MYYMPHFCLGMRWKLFDIARQLPDHTKHGLSISEAIFTWPIGYVLGDERTGEMRFHFDGPHLRIVNTLTRKEIIVEKVKVSDFVDLGHTLLSRHGLSDHEEKMIGIVDRALQDTYWDNIKDYLKWSKDFYSKGRLEQQGYEFAY
jgi:hypothetical protein